MSFEFGTPGRIIFGAGEFANIPQYCADLGPRALIVTGGSSLRESGDLKRLEDMLREAGIETLISSVASEPTVSMIDGMVREAWKFSPAMVVAVGGGSVLDAGKAVASLLANNDSESGSVLDYLEGVGRGRPILKTSVPLIAVPTTAGTGSEVTRNAVITADDRTFKKSMRHARMRAQIAIVDSDLMLSAPSSVTAASGADAQAQLIEAYLSLRATFMTDGFALDGISMVSDALEESVNDGSDAGARGAMAMAAMLGGIALDNAGLGAVHGLASPIGAFFDIPHGVICANLLPVITRMNIDTALRARRSDEHASDILERCVEVASLLTDDEECEPYDLPDYLDDQLFRLELPSLGAFGVTSKDIPRIVENCRGGSMKTNPFELTDRELSKAVESRL